MAFPVTMQDMKSWMDKHGQTLVVNVFNMYVKVSKTFKNHPKLEQDTTKPKRPGPCSVRGLCGPAPQHWKHGTVTVWSGNSSSAAWAQGTACWLATIQICDGSCFAVPMGSFQRKRPPILTWCTRPWHNRFAACFANTPALYHGRVWRPKYINQSCNPTRLSSPEAFCCLPSVCMTGNVAFLLHSSRHNPCGAGVAPVQSVPKWPPPKRLVLNFHCLATTLAGQQATNSQLSARAYESGTQYLALTPLRICVSLIHLRQVSPALPMLSCALPCPHAHKCILCQTFWKTGLPIGIGDKSKVSFCLDYPASCRFLAGWPWANHRCALWLHCCKAEAPVHLDSLAQQLQLAPSVGHYFGRFARSWTWAPGRLNTKVLCHQAPKNGRSRTSVSWSLRFSGLHVAFEKLDCDQHHVIPQLLGPFAPHVGARQSPPSTSFWLRPPSL